MTSHTQATIEAAIDRLLDELGVDDYEKLIASIDDVILYALCRQFGVVKVLPQTTAWENFSEARQRIATRENLRQLGRELEEPSPEELTLIIQKFRCAPSMLKKVLTQSAGKIRPHGGSPEKLADRRKVHAITDEIHEAMKAGKRLEAAQLKIARREDDSLKTVRTRDRQEMKR